MRRGGSVSSLLSASRRLRPRRAGGPRCGEAPRPGPAPPEPRSSSGPVPSARASLTLSAAGLAEKGKWPRRAAPLREAPPGCE